MVTRTLEAVPFAWPEHTAKPPCQWGACGHCTSGRCDSCQFRRDPSRVVRFGPHTHVLDKRGGVVSPTVRVYVMGETANAWVCSCHRAGHADGQLVLL